MIDLIPIQYRIALAAFFVAIAALGLFAYGHRQYAKGEAAGRAQVQQRWDAERRVQTADALKRSEANARETFRRLELGAAAERKRDEAFAALDTRLRAALGELQNRPERPVAASGAASNPAPVASCTGAELYRPDAEFLVREAARAQRILSERDYCHDRYDALSKPK